MNGFYKLNLVVFGLAKICLLILLSTAFAAAQTNYEGVPISEITVTVENSKPSQFVIDQLETIVRGVLPAKFSAVKNREALKALFDSGRVATARLEATEVVRNQIIIGVNLRFIVRRTTLVDQVTISVGETDGEKVTEAELLLRLNLLTTNAVVSERAVQQSADAIQSYLRERGYYQAEVTFNYEPLSQRDARSNVSFVVTPKAQARVENFEINITNFDNVEFLEDLKLQKGELFSRARLTTDVERIRAALVKEDFLAATLTEPRVTYDGAKNTVSIVLNGNANAKVTIRIEDEDGKEIELSERTQRKILPIKREGEVSASAIVEGERRLRTRFQEDGYFFAEVAAVCGVTPFTAEDANIFTNNTGTACDFLDGLNLAGRQIDVVYKATLNRRFRLKELRLEGADKIIAFNNAPLTIADVKPALQSQEANALGIIPRLGYGRGFTSEQLLDDDDRTLTSLLRELGYENADVRVRRGVSPEGEDLIITFVVRAGVQTIVRDVKIEGNTKFTDAEILVEINKPNVPGQTNDLIGRAYSRVRTRNGSNRISELYSRNGFVDAGITFGKQDVSQTATEKLVDVVYTVEREGEKTYVNRIFTIGNNNVKRESILETIALNSGDVLRADKITESERNLYSADVFSRVTVTTEPAGQTFDGNARRDVLIDLQEDKSRLITYGGGISSDDGPSGFVDFRHFNLFGRLYQGGARIRASRRQQLIQLDLINPRFRREPDGKFAPLSLTAAYTRDTGVTRFFRTTVDQGALGIVQRLDEEGNPIDEFGAQASAPSINRLSFNLETSRTINREKRSLLFVRYRYEDVRLLNVNSLVVAPVLRPDRNVRISGLGATFGRDTRENCNNQRSFLEILRTGEPGNPCQYNASDPTRGEFLSVDYQLSARFLGGNTSFNKITATYQRYYQFGSRFRKTVIAGRAILGVASLFNIQDRDGNGTIDETDRTLPISERFFGGGSLTLRGFDFEQAGPRQVIAPQGGFRDRDNNIVFISPFAVPVGGNALAITNVEARVPLNNFFQVVPFYDGGNIFRRASEIFKPRARNPNDLNDQNFRSVWTNTVGLGLRLRTPIGGSVAVDFGYLLNPPEFLIPQNRNPPATLRLPQNQIHFRFSQSF